MTSQQVYMQLDQVWQWMQTSVGLTVALWIIAGYVVIAAIEQAVTGFVLIGRSIVKFHRRGTERVRRAKIRKNQDDWRARASEQSTLRSQTQEIDDYV